MASISQKLAEILDEYNMVQFHQLDYKDNENIQQILFIADSILQYGEGLEPQTKDFDIS
jgi:hypothetical protein|eukprot:CAMPEP_0168313750 /NCGR_PEP_ID=MMETSP0210-20121227/4153_1 /TAXON_ID=40633 /ORGANISM="Condylostoma magnum, Strain COL2" /LENGTH=58 /DNA_ID=CAMNT_0008274419 /DNA_START=628 /DNA_END=804 /DNA_ORIENTATION=-